MRFLLNGGFHFQGEEYYRVDDMDRMVQEQNDGTYDVIAHLKRFGIAINKHNVSPEQARAIVDAINATLSPAKEGA